jgi:hypothetical protein
MTDRLDSAIVREITQLGTSDPLALMLVTYLGAAFHASLFGGFQVFIAPHQEKIRELLNSPPSNAKLQPQDLGIIGNVAHQLELVYRLAVFDSFLNNLTSYALAARPSKAFGTAHMQVSVLMAKTRAAVVNEYITRRTKSLSRENFGTRIQALREIAETDFRFEKDDMDNLKRLSNLRNAIIHEGSAFQFTVDDDLRIRSHAETQTITMSRAEKFELINRIAASLYEQYVTRFIGRKLTEVEQGTLDALNNRPKTNDETMSDRPA